MRAGLGHVGQQERQIGGLGQRAVGAAPSSPPAGWRSAGCSRPRRSVPAVSPELESARTASCGVIMPRSPWLASPGWTYWAGVPVEAKVAAILRADMAALAHAGDDHPAAAIAGQQVERARQTLIEAARQGLKGGRLRAQHPARHREIVGPALRRLRFGLRSRHVHGQPFPVIVWRAAVGCMGIKAAIEVTAVIPMQEPCPIPARSMLRCGDLVDDFIVSRP